MQDRYLKARVPRALYEALLVRSGEAGQRLGTYVREVLERDAQAITTGEALTRIETALAAATTGTAPAQPAVPDHELRRELAEVRLLVRELAMQSNAQILSRVAAQLAAQSQQPSR
jgi:hypothetical protein